MLLQGNGSIINTASMSAKIVNRPQRHVPYNAAKAGVGAIDPHLRGGMGRKRGQSQFDPVLDIPLVQ